MSYDRVIDGLEAEWSPEGGFFWELRQGRFSPHAFDRVLETIRELSFEEDERIPRRAVSLLWYIPLFMQWQVDRIQEGGGDLSAYLRATRLITNEMERLLGVP